MKEIIQQAIQRIRPNNLPRVTLEGITTLANRDWMKFIQIQDRETETMYLRADPKSEYHREILDKFRDEALSTLGVHYQEGRFFCPGGGGIQVEHAKQEVVFYGRSEGFGRYDKKIVKTLATPYLRREMPGWKATFE